MRRLASLHRHRSRPRRGRRCGCRGRRPRLQERGKTRRAACRRARRRQGPLLAILAMLASLRKAARGSGLLRCSHDSGCAAAAFWKASGRRASRPSLREGVRLALRAASNKGQDMRPSGTARAGERGDQASRLSSLTRNGEDAAPLTRLPPPSPQIPPLARRDAPCSESSRLRRAPTARPSERRRRTPPRPNPSRL